MVNGRAVLLASFQTRKFNEALIFFFSAKIPCMVKWKKNCILLKGSTAFVVCGLIIHKVNIYLVNV